MDKIAPKRREYNRAWYLAHRETERAKARSRAKERRAKNPEYMQRWRASNPDKVRKHNRNFYERNQPDGYFRDWYRKNARAVSERTLKKKYGIDLEEYQKILDSQGGGCAICGGKPKDSRLPVDHNHVTGVVRGILCHICNKALGCLRDRPELAEKAASYLRERGSYG